MKKEQIIGFIVEENYNELLNIYRSNSKSFNLAVFRKLNTGNTPSNLKTLIYEVRKANGIEDLDLYEINNNQEVKIDAVDTGAGVNPTPALPEGEGVGNLTPALPEGEGVGNSTPALPEGEGVGIREEFPFLNDENCPDVLKIAVADKITAYKKHQEISDLLQKHSDKEVELTAEDLVSLAKQGVEAHHENASLYDELMYYREKGTYLAKHPLFWKEKIQQELELMNAEELLKYKKASEVFFKRNEEDLKKSTSEERTKELQEKASIRKFKNDLVELKISQLK